MRRFVARGEIRKLDEVACRGQRGSFTRLSDGHTHYELAGPDADPLVVLVPGLTVPLDFWDGVVARLNDRGVRTLAYSAYGRGFSERVAGPYDPALFVRQLDELLHAVDARDIHLVGTSMGALIALRYAHRRGVPIASLTLCGPAGFAKQDNPVAKLPEPLAVLVGKHLLRRNLLRHLARNVGSEVDAARLRPLVLKGFQFEGSAYALLSTLRHFPLAAQDALFDATAMTLPPTMLLWGTEDQVTPVTDYGRAAELLRPVAQRVIEGCGHMVPFERPGEFADHLQSFITERVA
jgi:pimeloyl-ACP methyl ester carboxylesterase